MNDAPVKRKKYGFDVSQFIQGVRLNKGFTLIELVTVSAIIGLLAAIAIPKFADMIDRARIAVLKANLGALRAALSIYYADTEGTMPRIVPNTVLNDVLVPKYIQEVRDVRWPKVFITGSNVQQNHPSNSSLFFPGCSDVNLTWPINEPYCDRGWTGGPTISHPNQLGITCRFHSDSRGQEFSTY